MHTRLLIVSLWLTAGICLWAKPNTPILDILELGGVNDGKTLNTKVIQGAINQCSESGGGTIYFPPGSFVTGSIIMKDGVSLYLEAGATLLGSTSIEDYIPIQPEYVSLRTNEPTKQLIFAENARNIAIRGRGTIDGQGAAFEKAEGDDVGKVRPHLIQMIACTNVLIEDVTLRNSGAWMQHYLACDYLTIRGIRVYNHCNYNNDMLDIDGCHYVTVSDCIGDSDDDALTFKSTSPRACENITVTNCIFSSHCNAIKMGTESTGGFRNIVISNCVVKPSVVEAPFYGTRMGQSGIALETVDGGVLEGISISNIRIEGTTSPIFVRLGNRARPHAPDVPSPGVGALHDVSISNIRATGASPTGCAISGIPGHPIRNLRLSDIDITFVGGGEASHSIGEVPEREADYPANHMFGVLPAYGFYVRHVEDIIFDNVRLRLQSPDQRSAWVFEDVQSLTVNDSGAERPSEEIPILRFHNVQGAVVSGNTLLNTPNAAGISGDLSQNILLKDR